MGRIPTDLRYSKDHEWVRIEDGLAVVGITDYAQDSLGEIVFVELPPLEESYEADEEIANIESVKAASAIFNPIAGTVAQVNEQLDGSPELVNKDCYSNFLYKLSGFNPGDLEGLLDADSYAAFLKTLA
jgi:glycine cleavage system H protein